MSELCICSECEVGASECQFNEANAELQALRERCDMLELKVAQCSVTYDDVMREMNRAEAAEQANKAKDERIKALEDALRWILHRHTSLDFFNQCERTAHVAQKALGGGR